MHDKKYFELIHLLLRADPIRTMIPFYASFGWENVQM